MSTPSRMSFVHSPDDLPVLPAGTVDRRMAKVIVSLLYDVSPFGSVPPELEELHRGAEAGAVREADDALFRADFIEGRQRGSSLTSESRHHYHHREQQSGDFDSSSSSSDGGDGLGGIDEEVSRPLLASPSSAAPNALHSGRFASAYGRLGDASQHRSRAGSAQSQLRQRARSISAKTSLVLSTWLRTPRFWLALAVVLVALVGILAVFFVAPKTDDVIEGAEADIVAAITLPGAALAFGAVLVLCNLLFVPAALPAIVGGFVFYIWWGSLIVWTAKFLSCLLAFPVGRLLLPHCGAYLRHNARLIEVLNRAVETRGWRIMLFLRLSPLMPHAKISYLLAQAPNARFFPQMLCSAVGLFPSVALFVYFGMMLRHATEIAAGKMPLMHDIYVAAGIPLFLLLVLGATFWTGRVLRKYLLETSLHVAVESQSVPFTETPHASQESRGTADSRTTSHSEASNRSSFSVASQPVFATPGTQASITVVGSYGVHSDGEETPSKKRSHSHHQRYL